MWSNFIGETYECNIIKNPMITTPNKIIKSAKGTQLPSLNNSNIQVFRAVSQTINYMPQKLYKIFPNLIEIWIESCHLKEIHQKDFQFFPQLKYLEFSDNEIRSLKKDLFKFNLELRWIRFYKNKIYEVHPKVFDNLKKLSLLDMQNNECFNGAIIFKDRFKIFDFIEEIYKNCSEGNKTSNEIIESLKKEIIEKSLKISSLESKLNNITQCQNTELKTNESSDLQKFFQKFITEQKVLFVVMISFLLSTFVCLLLSLFYQCNKKSNN
ncbi:hypothetical protein PVAND_016166 [Polypedilum vanderplanki]|uniref:Leucine rich repeat protein n=1 Tax=Polypedilum vanderplanki TaxID=319348 RepID=A0A9J6BET0_POLVA|nr:hypothetical protein PVAND_016166 [Polypedilum vanderplanki]